MSDSESSKLGFNFKKWNWKHTVGCGILVVIGTYLLYKNTRKCNTEDYKKIRELAKKINQANEEVEESLVTLSVVKEKQVNDDKLSMKFSLVQNLGTKVKASHASPSNPFRPPFQKGIFITDLPPRHRLLFNKFNILKNHVLIVTQQFEDQETPLSQQDFEQCALVTSALKGVFFFNCGPNSGFSQKHKHIQVFPQQARNFPILKQIRQEIKDNKLIKMNKSPVCLFNNFDFIHAIIPITSKYGDQTNLEELSKDFFEAFIKMKQLLSMVLKQKQFSFNLVGCHDFVMMVPRKSQFIFKSIGINGCGFMGTILFKDEQLFEKIEFLAKPSEILKEITYTEKPN